MTENVGFAEFLQYFIIVGGFEEHFRVVLWLLPVLSLDPLLLSKWTLLPKFLSDLRKLTLRSLVCTLMNLILFPVSVSVSLYVFVLGVLFPVSVSVRVCV